MAQPMPIAGWYPDPEFAGHDRWWDGVGWSESRRTSVAAVAAAGATLTAAAPGDPSASDPSASASSASAPSAGAPAYAAVPAGRNSLAIVGLVLSISGIIMPFVINSLAGGIVSWVGLHRSKKLADQGISANGRNISIAGILIGFIWGGVCLLLFVGWIAFTLWVIVTANDVQVPVTTNT